MSDNLFERDERGLIKGVKYYYTSEGRIDWKKMVDPKFLYVTSEYKERACQEQNCALENLDLSKVNDKYLRITIGGINQLANLRGYLAMDYPIMHVSDGSVTVTCAMTFIGNYETDMAPVSCAAVASANLYNVDKDFCQYLATFAENRAFTRCVKRALQINIVGEDEIGIGTKQEIPQATSHSETPSSAPVAGFEARHLLETKCNERSITFEQMKSAAALHANTWVKAPVDWNGFEDIQPTDAFFVLGKMDEADKKKKSKAKK
jgi:hypothetical protein